MNLQKLRDKLNTERGRNEQAKLSNERALAKIKEIIDSFDAQEIVSLQEKGFDISYIKSIDFGKLENEEYLESLKRKNYEMAEKVSSFLEGAYADKN